MIADICECMSRQWSTCSLVLAVTEKLHRVCSSSTYLHTHTDMFIRELLRRPLQNSIISVRYSTLFCYHYHLYYRTTVNENVEKKLCPAWFPFVLHSISDLNIDNKKPIEPKLNNCPKKESESLVESGQHHALHNGFAFTVSVVHVIWVANRRRQIEFGVQALGQQSDRHWSSGSRQIQPGELSTEQMCPNSYSNV